MIQHCCCETVAFLNTATAADTAAYWYHPEAVLALVGSFSFCAVLLIYLYMAITAK